MSIPFETWRRGTAALPGIGGVVDGEIEVLEGLAEHNGDGPCFQELPIQSSFFRSRNGLFAGYTICLNGEFAEDGTPAIGIWTCSLNCVLDRV